MTYLGSFVAANGKNYGPDIATFYYGGVLTGLPIVPCIGQRAADAIALVAKYQPNRRDALFFMPGGDDVSVALFSGHRQRLGYTSMATDFISRPLMVEVDRRMYERIKSGDVLITMAYISISKGVPADGQKLVDNALLGVDFVENLGLLFQECEIERTPRDVVAVRLMPKGERACEGIGKPFAFEKRYIQF